MRILVADTFPEGPRAELAEQGHECRYEPGITARSLSERLADCSPEVLIVRSTPVSSADLAQAEGLRLVIRAGSGTNTIDCATAAEQGVYVCNVPGRNAVAVAELAFGLLLALDRNIPDNVADLRTGRWDKRRYASARGICGRKVGVLGLGNIGLAFAERARAFGAEVYSVTKPDRSAEALWRATELGINFVDDLPALARACDVLSLHLPATAATHRLVNRDILELMAEGTIVLNTARAELVDEQALLEAMDTKGLRVGVDVYADEPGASSGTITSRLAEHPNCYGTHHIGASTEQAQHAVAAEVVRMVGAFESGTLPNCVNLDKVRGAQQPPHTRLVSVSSPGGAR